MWIQLLCVQNLEKQGRRVTYRPGDWVDVGKQLALRLVAEGSAVVPGKAAGIIPEQAGVVLSQESALESLSTQFEQANIHLPVRVGSVQIAYQYTLCYNIDVLLRIELLGVGFHLLETWEIACPLYSYTELAQSLGSEDDRARTAKVIRDLRVPVYDIRLLFLRDCENVRNLLQLWNRDHDGNEYLSFLRAFYRVKPLMLALPITWTQPKAYSDAV